MDFSKYSTYHKLLSRFSELTLSLSVENEMFTVCHSTCGFRGHFHDEHILFLPLFSVQTASPKHLTSDTESNVK